MGVSAVPVPFSLTFTRDRFAAILARAEDMVRKALGLKPENKEANGLLRELLGDENCRRKEMSLQVCAEYCTVGEACHRVICVCARLFSGVISPLRNYEYGGDITRDRHGVNHLNVERRYILDTRVGGVLGIDVLQLQVLNNTIFGMSEIEKHTRVRLFAPHAGGATPTVQVEN